MGRNVTTPPAVPPSPVKSIQTGYINNVGTATLGGEDAGYFDVTVASVNPAKCLISFEGSGSKNGSIGRSYYGAATAGENHIVSARMTSATNLRLSVGSSGGALGGRWTVVEYN